MTVYELMAKLGSVGIKLWVEENQLKFKAPKGALTPDLKKNLIDNKQAVIDFLKEARVSDTSEKDSIPKADRSLPIPLSHAQQRLWFIEQLTPGSSTFHIPAALYLTGILDYQALESAFLELILRHEALRTVFSADGEEPTQIINPIENFHIPLESLMDYAEGEKIAEVKRRVEKEVQTSFDLTKGPLIRARLYQLDDNKHGLIVTMHHIVTDGWSMGIFVREISALYAAQRMGISAPLPELDIQYADFAAWQRNWLQGEELDRQLSYWRLALDQAPSQLALPFDRPRPTLQTLNGAIENVEFGAQATAALRKLAKEFDTTLYVVLMSIYKVVLSRWAQQKDICVGMPVAGRTRAEVEGLIGFFVNTLVIRTRFQGNPSFRDIISEVKERVLGAQSHQDVPFEAIVEELNTPRNLSFSPLYQVALSLTSSDGTAKKAVIGGLEIEPMPIDLVAARLDLTMMLVDQGDQVEGMLEYNTDLFDRDTIKQFLNHFSVTLHAFSQDLSQTVDSLQLIKQDELLKKIENPESIAAIVPLTPMQRDFYLDSLHDPETNRNSIGYAAKLPFAVDVQRWHGALQDVHLYNPQLRSRIVSTAIPGADSFYQVVLKHDEVDFQVLDWSSCVSTREQLMLELDKLALPAWNVENKQLTKHYLVMDANADCWAVTAAHHSVFDGISKYQHLSQLLQAYQGQLNVADYSAQLSPWVQNRIQLTDTLPALNFWAHEFSAYQPIANRAADPGKANITHWVLDESEYSEFQRWCSEKNVSSSNYFRTLYTLALQRCYFESDEFVLVDAISGRDNQTQDWIGCCFQFTPFIQHKDQLDCASIDEVFTLNRSWKKTLGNAQYLSMLARRQFVASDELEFQFNYRMPLVSQPLSLDGQGFHMIPIQPDNAGIVKLLVTPGTSTLELRLSHRENEFQGFDLLQRMKQVHEQIIAGVSGLHELDWLLPEERNSLINSSGGNNKAIGTTLVQRFKNQVDLAPDNCAVIFGADSLTYRELDRLSNQYAHLIRGEGISTKDKVAICISRCLDLPAVFLGAVKSGAAYVPLDVNYPVERLRYIIEDSEASSIITQQCVLDRLTEQGVSFPECVRILLLEDIRKQFDTLPDTELEYDISLDSVLYYVYTSGSTGQPKGAGVYHRGESNLLNWYGELLNCSKSDRVLLMSALGFDLTQKNLYMPFCSGAALVIPIFDEYDPEQLIQTINQNQITVINCAPSAFYPLIEDEKNAVTGLRHVVLGGEPIRVDIVRRWLNRRDVNATVTNSYGPTECSDVVASYSVRELDDATNALPIGKPIPNTRLYVVNKRGQLMPSRASGELRVSGAGVGAGYWRREELNQNAFQKCPFDEGLWYSTGDICQQHRDGNVHYIGRTDHQIKLRGLRIELGEIDSQLRTIEGVVDVLSLVQDDTLVSYILTEQKLDVEMVKTSLRKALPEFMIPSAIVTIAHWPLTPNGKIDRVALPLPNDVAQQEFVAPRNESERIVADIWCQVLKLSEVSVTANFFEIGGHSLLATQVVSRVRKAFDLEISVRALFEAPTVEKLVRFIASASASGAMNAAPPIEPQNPPNRDTLSFAQYRLWFVDQLNQGSSEYNLPEAMMIHGALDLVVLDRVFGEIVARHEVLRTNFSEQDGVPKLIVHDASAWQSDLIDLTSTPDELIEKEVARFVDEDAARVYSLEADSLFTTRILKLSEKKHILLLNMHHIVSDGWSLGVLVSEIQALYPAFLAGHPSPLPELAIQYSDFSVWQRQWIQGDVLDSMRTYWQAALSGAPDVLRLPTDKPRPKHQTFNGAHLSIHLGAELSKQVNQFCAKNDLTPFMILMAAYQIMLSRYAGQKDICVGIPIAGRNRSELEGLIGFFINGLVIRTKMEDNPSIKEYLQQVKDVALGAYAHQDMPADLLLDAIKMERSADTSPGAQVGFALQNVAREQLHAEMAGLSIEPVPREHKTAKYELSLILQESGDEFAGVFEYNTDLFLEPTIDQMAVHFKRILQQLIINPEQMIEHVQMVSSDELHDLLRVDSSTHQLKPLSPMQRDMYLDSLMQPDTLKNSLGYHFIIEGDFDVQLWITATLKLIEQQPMLRATIKRSEIPYTDVAYLNVANKADVSIQVEDWSHKITSDDEASRYAQDLIWQPYDIEGDLSQYVIIKLDSGRHLVVFRMNHIVLDGAGMAVHLVNSIAYAESMRIGEVCDQAPNLFEQYVEDNTKRTDSTAVLKFWRDKSVDIEALDFSIAPELSAGKSTRVEKTTRLSDHHWQNVKRFCKEHNITPSLYFKALYGLLINAYCRGEADFYISEVVGGRVGQHKRAFGNYFQVLPVVYPKNVFSGSADINGLFSYIRQYRKSLRSNANVSLMAQRRILPQGRLHFMFNYYNFIPSMQLFGSEIKLKAYPQVQDGPIQFVVHEQDGWLDLNLFYLSDLFCDIDFLARMESLSEQIVHGAKQISDLKLFLPNEMPASPRQESAHNSLQALNTVVEGFDVQAQKTPDAIAVKHAGKHLTYRELQHKSNQLAAWLAGQGVVNSTKVGICLDRGMDMLVAVLGTLKSGSAYVPMDSNYPAERLHYILQDSSAPILLTQHCVSERIRNAGVDLDSIKLIELDASQDWLNHSAEVQPRGPSKDDSIYVIYTSGSTGLPKGAQLNHAGEINLQDWYINRLGITSSDKFLLMGAFGFDLTQKNLFAPLLVGGSLIIPDMQDFDLEVIASTIVDEEVSVVNCAPSSFYPLVENASQRGYPFPSLRYLILGGEPIRLPALTEWLTSSGCKLVNSYGPTECTDVVAYHIYDPATNQDAIPIGKPITNTQLYVVDSADHLLPPGLVGELCIAGVGVGNGYINKEELSQKVFQDNPFSEGTWYRSGDLVRQRFNGDIEYIGRKDFQVKIRGLRIELGEIEASLRKNPHIHDSLTVVRNDQLVSYIISEPDIDVERTKVQLRNALPDYMVPSVIVSLQQWPLTPNGKIDRSNLPDPEASGRPPYVAPRNETEEILAGIWSEVLGVEHIGINDSFFDLGGHSLLAARAVSKFRQAFEVDIQLRALFELHTIADIAQYLDTMRWAAQSAELEHSGDQEAGREEGFL